MNKSYRDVGVFLTVVIIGVGGLVIWQDFSQQQRDQAAMSAVNSRQLETPAPKPVEVMKESLPTPPSYGLFGLVDGQYVEIPNLKLKSWDEAWHVSRLVWKGFPASEVEKAPKLKVGTRLILYLAEENLPPKSTASMRNPNFGRTPEEPMFVTMVGTRDLTLAWLIAPLFHHDRQTVEEPEEFRIKVNSPVLSSAPRRAIVDEHYSGRKTPESALKLIPSEFEDRKLEDELVHMEVIDNSPLYELTPEAKLTGPVVIYDYGYQGAAALPVVNHHFVFTLED